MELAVAQNCPSCGAEIVLAEDTRMLRCPYCDVNNYRLERTAPRYLLPARLPVSIAADEVLYIPYLRFKGTVYEVREGSVEHRLVDTTRLGIAAPELPASLGLRPQAMRLLPLTVSRPGRYLHRRVEVAPAPLLAELPYMQRTDPARAAGYFSPQKLSDLLTYISKRE